MMRERFYPDQMTRKGGKGDLISAKTGDCCYELHDRDHRWGGGGPMRG